MPGAVIECCRNYIRTNFRAVVLRVLLTPRVAWLRFLLLCVAQQDRAAAL